MACICGETCTDALCGAYPPKPIPNANGYLVAISGVGAPGSQGPQGEPGPVGPEGPVGAVGPVGPAGPQGPQGAKGDTGAAGAAGAVGPVGPAGPQGLKGDTGATGATGPVGPQGARGPVGPTGPAGPQGIPGRDGGTGPQGEPGVPGAPGPVGGSGPTGPAGPQGIQGPEGPQGPAGLGINYKGTIATVDDLPATAVEGDLYLVEIPAPSHGWIWDETEQVWVDAGPVQGPVGPEGPQGVEGAVGPVGPVGPQGLQGETGAAGPIGPQGVEGPQGPQGPQGIQGEQGIQGAPGLGITFKGEVPTYADLPSSGQTQGDMWVVADPQPAHGWVWDAATSTWVDGGPVQGPQGIQGEQGVPGVQGPAGPSQVSADAGNQSRLGSDSLIYTPAQTTIAGYLPLAGGTMTGTITAPMTVNALTFGTSAYGILGGNGGIALRQGSTNMVVATTANVNTLVKLQVNALSDALQFGSNGPTMGRVAGVQEVQASGHINVNAAPTAGTHLCNKAYVDQVAAGGGGTEYVLPPATTTTLGGVKAGTGITVTADGTISASLAGNYVNKAGDVMNGPLRWANSGGVSTFNGTDVYMYYDGTYFRCYMPSGRQGWIVEVATGQVLFPGAVPNCNFAPSATGDLTNKKYVDDSFANNTTFLKLSGGTMTGTITAPSNGTAGIAFGTTGNTIVGGSGGIALKSGATNVLTTTSTSATFATQIVTSNGSAALRFGSAGPTMGVSGVDVTSSAAILASTAPTAGGHLTNKTYVDSRTVVTAVGAAAPATTGLADGALWVEV